MVCHIFCSSLSHVGIAVFVQSFRSFYSLHFFTHTATPTPRKSCHSFAHSVPFRYFHFQGSMSFPTLLSMWLQHCSVSLHKASPPHTYTPYRSFRYTPLHSLIAFHFTHFTFRVYVFSRPANPRGCSRVSFHSTPLHHRIHTPFQFIRSNTLHSFITFSPCISNATFGQKNAPNQLPAAPVHRAPRFLCPGHSLHSQRLAHNAQASYFVSLLSHFSLAIHAGSRLFFLFRFKPASPTPTPDHPPLI